MSKYFSKFNHKLLFLIFYIFIFSNIFSAGPAFDFNIINKDISKFIFFFFIFIIIFLALFLLVPKIFALQIFVVSFLFTVSETIVIVSKEASTMFEYKDLILNPKFFLYIFFRFFILDMFLLVGIFVLWCKIFWYFVPQKFRKISAYSLLGIYGLITLVKLPSMFFQIIIFVILFFIIKKFRENIPVIFFGLAFSGIIFVCVYTIFFPKVFSPIDFFTFAFIFNKPLIKEKFYFEFGFMIKFYLKLFFSFAIILFAEYFLYKLFKLEKLQNKLQDKFYRKDPFMITGLAIFFVLIIVPFILILFKSS
ncbi:MAG: hypothetical protein ACRCSK_07890 [Fusobacteriaceae bacterium]